MSRRHTDPLPFFDSYFLREYGSIVFDEERTKKETDVIERVLGAKKDAAICDLACGTGRHAIEIAVRGYTDVTGIDAVDLLLRRARRDAKRAGVEVRFHKGDIRNIRRRARFDRIYNWFTAWGYYDHKTNRRSLTNIRRALKPRGRFAMDLISRDHLMRMYQRRDWNEKDDGEVVLHDRDFDPATGLMRLTVTRIKGNRRTVRRIDHFVYSASELRRMMLAAGFRRVEVFGGDGATPLCLRQDNNRMIFVARV
jgi:SAM-dependent methyltransferase